VSSRKNHIDPSPPRFFLRFFKWFCHPDLHTYIEGDLLEFYRERAEKIGERKADWLFIRDVLLLFRPDIIRPFEGYHQLNYYGMFKNYLKIGIRNILKYKVFSSINIFGLSVAMSICLLIILMLVDQKSYDNFHTKGDRIYRVLMHPKNNRSPYVTVPFPIASTLKTDYSIIDNTTCLRRGFGGDALYKENLAEIKGYFADVSFLEIFSFPLIQGDIKTALIRPNTMVISRTIAHQLFGYENPVGKSVDFTDRGIDFFSDETDTPINWGDYLITGVFEDKGYKSHLEFDVLVSASSMEILYKEEKLVDLTDNWSNHYQSYAYVLLKENATETQLATVLNELAERKYSDNENLEGSRFFFQPLSKITPGPLIGNAPTIRLPLFVYYILSALAFVIMVSACLNYTNLSIARALTRAKEIGVRKVNGARRKDLIFQFLSESIITTLLALCLAFIFLIFLKSAFLELWINKYLNFDLNINFEVILSSFVFAITVGLLAGIFPALSLSGYQPIKALKSLKSRSKGKLGLRKTLTTFQFVISLLFIITSMVVFNQFKYFMQYEYGFNSQNLININLQSNDFEVVKSAFNSVPSVSSVSNCAYLPVTGRNDGITLKRTDKDDKFTAIDLSADKNFINTLKINLLAGQNLTDESTNNEILVNEATVKKLGFDNAIDIVGESIEMQSPEALKVIGVIEDFTFRPLIMGREIEPVIVRNIPEKFKFISVKIKAGNERETIQQLEDKWKAIDSYHPLDYEYYEDRLANNNQGVFDIVSIIGLIAFLAITIACLGLLGMAIYITERRTKEVGIRKVLGAGGYKLAFLLSKEFLIILIIAVAIAAPLSFFLNSLWLNFLVTRVELGMGTILLGSFALLFLGLIIIVPQTLRISNQNPVDSLKSE